MKDKLKKSRQSILGRLNSITYSFSYKDETSSLYVCSARESRPSIPGCTPNIEVPTTSTTTTTTTEEPTTTTSTTTTTTTEVPIPTTSTTTTSTTTTTTTTV